MMPQLSQPRVRVQRLVQHYRRSAFTLPEVLAHSNHSTWSPLVPLCAPLCHSHATGQELAPMASRLDWTTKTAASFAPQCCVSRFSSVGGFHSGRFLERHACRFGPPAWLTAVGSHLCQRQRCGCTRASSATVPTLSLVCPIQSFSVAPPSAPGPARALVNLVACPRPTNM